jgi:outer membrane protein assembly factor BamD (BamD/ComL family)
MPPTAANLAAETRLLAQAQSKLNEGAAAPALALLDQHRAEFPHGELVPEREAARVLALCALGRTADAKAARRRFERNFSSSPLLARVRAVCGRAAE